MVAKREFDQTTLGVVWEWLIRPSVAIEQAVERRQSRLLASLLIVLIVMGVVADVIWLLDVPDAGLTAELVLGALLVLTAAYVLNRRGQYRLAAVVTVITPALFSAALIVTHTVNPNVAISYAILGILLSSIFLTLRATVLVAVGTVIGICMLFVAMPDFDVQAVLGALNLNAAGAALILLAAHHRNRLENDRLSALAESEARLRYQADLLENISDAVISTDKDFTIRSWNKAAETMFGWKAQEVIGKSGIEIIKTEYLDEPREQTLKQFFEKGYWQGEIVQRRKDGTPIHVLASGVLLKDDMGNPVGTVSVNRDITERKLADGRLKESEQRFRALVENSSDAIALFADDGTILYGSPSTSRVLGYSLDEFNGRNAFELIHPDDHKSVTNRLAESLRQPGVAIPVQADVLHKDGRWRRLEGIFTNLLADPSVRAIVNNYRDVTERELAEEALRESQTRLSGIVGSAMDAIITIDADQRIVLLNTAAEAMFGCSAVEVIGQPIERFIPHQFRDVHRHHIEVFSRTGVTSRRMGALGTISGLRSNGETFPIEASISQVETGNRKYYTVILRDISARLQSVEALRRSEERFRLLIEQAADGIFVAGTDGKYLDVNSKGCQMLGYSREELLQLNVHDIVIEADVALAPARIEELRAGATLLSERMMRRKHGVIFPTETSARMLPDGSIQSIVRDISERKRIEAELRLSEERYRIVSELMSDYAYMVRVLPGPGYATQLEWVTGPFTQITGYSIDEAMAGLDWTSSIFPEDMPIVERRRQKMQAGQKDVSEFRMIRKNGEIYWLRSYTHPQWDEGQQRVVRIYSAVQDITERKQAEEALRDSEQRLRTVLENMPVMLDALDETGNLIVWNRECERVTGYTATELIGNPQAMSLLYPNADYLDKMLGAWNARGNNYYNWEWELVARDGIARTIAWSNISEILPVAGWPSWGIGVDVTERVQAEAALRRANEELERRVEERTLELSTANTLLNQERNLLRTLIDNLPSHVFVKDTNSRFVLFNPGVIQQLGAAASDEVIGKSDFDFYPPEVARKYYEAEQAVIGTGQPIINQEHYILDPGGGSRWILETKVPLRDSDGKISGLVGLNHNITERKRADDVRRQMEERTRLTIDGAYEAFIAIDDEGIITDWNRQAEASFGWSRQEALGQLLANTIIPQQHREAHRQGMKHFLATGEGPLMNKRVEIMALHRDGHQFPVELTITPVQWGDNYIFSAFLHDITERKETEAKLQYQANLLAKVNDAVVTSDDKFVLRSWNDAAERIYGWQAEEVLGKLGQEVFRSEFIGIEREEAISQLVETGQLHAELIQYRKDGQPIYVEGDVIALKDEGGRTTGYLSVNRDITERKRAEDEILKLNESLERRVAERTQQLGFLADASKLLTESFDYAERLKQLAHLLVPQIADWCAVDVIAEDGTLERLAVVHTDPAKVELAYELQRRYPADPDAPRGVYNVLRTHQSEMYEDIPDSMLVASARDAEQLTILRELGLRSAMTVPLVAHGRAFGAIILVTAESARHYGPNDLALAEDLARRAALLIDNSRLYQEAQRLNSELEERVVERTAQLETANKELEAFTYSVSHDLRAPLRAMDGFSRIVMDEYASQLPSDAQRYLQLVRDNAQQMGELINGLLMLSRLGRQPLQTQPVAPRELVRQVFEGLRLEMENRQVEVTIGDLPDVQADAALLRQVFANLIQNALKFTRTREVATIEAGSQLVENRPVFFIKDNGVGFDMRYAHKLFGVFQRMHRAEDFEGTGIGLATVQRIIHRHGGRVWVESEADKGTTFYFILGADDHAN